MDGPLIPLPLIPDAASSDPAGEPIVADASPEPVAIERAERLSRSVLWKLQRAYFERVGIDAWRKGHVPHYITSNPFVAAAYARVVLGLLRDLAAAGARAAGEPLAIVELGAGSGRFAYHFLRKLFAEPRSPLLEGAPVRYVMTDVSPANLAFWRAHPQLQPFFDAGVLDVALFDAERDETLHLDLAGTTITPGDPARALVVIANYVFDGLPQDAYLLKRGVLHESRVRLSRRAHAGEGLSDPAQLQQIEVAFEHLPIGGDPDLDPDFRFLLDEYRSLLDEGAFQLPTASLACIRALSRLAGGRLLLLSADKGYCREEELLYRSDPEITRHGSVSLMVNYHAVARYVEHLGGCALFPAQRGESLCVGAFLLDAPAGGAETAAAFSEVASEFGPDDWFALKKGVEAARGEMGLLPLLAALRLSGPDGKVLMDVFDRLMELAPEANAQERRASFALARRIWEMHYHLGEERDLAFHLGVWMREIGYLAEAISFFERSLALYGLTPVTAYNLAYCHFGQQRGGEALRWIEEALAGAPDLPGGRALRTEIRAVLRDEAPSRGSLRAAS